MNWPWSRRAPTPGLMEALDSISQGHRDLSRAKKLTGEAREVAADLRESHRINHFGIALEATMRGTSA